MVIAGLTGSIATGKSTVAKIFKQAGALVIDADQIAQDAVRAGTRAYEGIVGHFGKRILSAGGEIDRDALGDIIFNNPGEKQNLNLIVHPEVFNEMASQLQKIESHDPKGLVILDVPLLFESHMEKGMDHVIVVYVPENIQLKRLINRNALSNKDAEARIRSQISIEKKKGLGDIMIDNSSTLEITRGKTLEVYERLKKEAQSR
ncbi:MAG: dephospho-CoA kinase [Thermodesulfobacteriota bacterium]|nr:dephospho-CoA kinase [Thermodesulfobacteriota bacterium]